MPTIKEIDGFSLIIHTRKEHLPVHIHVWKGRGKTKGKAVIDLGDENTLASLDEVNGYMSAKEAKTALKLCAANKGLLLRRWREIWNEVHGER